MRPFVILWVGQAFSLLGSQVVQFALVWWIARTIGSATWLAWASLAALLPQIFLGPLAGALVDRWNRKTVMIAADAVIALATLGLAVGFWLRLATIWTVYVVLLIRATGAAFHWPAMQASTTLMVPQKNLARVGGLNQTLFGLAGIVIPPLGALALEVLPMPGLLSIDIATAALAELYALLSALANCPLRQDIAVTGSINRHGQVQPVGGLDEKIEGFFDICRSRGLSGQQGVLIPDANRRNLMLRDDVIEAVRAGQFNVWAIRDVDEGIPLLSGLPAGELEAGLYTAGSFHRAVADRLTTFAEVLRSFSPAGDNGHRARVAQPSKAQESRNAG